MSSQQQFISVKVSYDGEMRRFPFPQGGSFASFQEAIQSLLGLDKNEKITLKYIDDEGDLVTLSSDLELKSAITGPLLRVTLVRKGLAAPPTPSAPAPVDLMDVGVTVGAVGSLPPSAPSTLYPQVPIAPPTFQATSPAYSYPPIPAPAPFSPNVNTGNNNNDYRGYVQAATTSSTNNEKFPDLSPLSDAMDVNTTAQRGRGRGGRGGFKPRGEFRPQFTPEEWLARRMQHKVDKEKRKEEKKEYKEEKKEQKEEDKRGKKEWKKDWKERKEWLKQNSTPDEREAWKQKVKEMKKAERAARVDAGRKAGDRCSGDGQKLVARHVKDVTVEDGSVIPAGTPFVKTWRVRNESAPWPAGCSLLFISKHRGDLMGGPESVPVPFEGPVPTNQELDISVSLVAPSMPGRYMGFWKMATPEGRKFGQRMWVSITVPASSSSPSSGSAGSSSSEGEADKYDALVDSVLAMGFNVKRHRVFHLLHKYNGDVEKVVVKLYKKAARKASKGPGKGDKK